MARLAQAGVVLLACLWLVPGTLNAAAAKNELEGIKKKIAKEKQSISQTRQREGSILQELKKIEGDLALLSVDAPQNGIVIYGDNWANNRKIQVGDTLFPGMPVLTLPDLSSLEAHGFVYDTDLRFVSAGTACTLSLDAVPGKSWQGTVVSLTSVASRKSFASQHKVFKAVIRPNAVDGQQPVAHGPRLAGKQATQVTIEFPHQHPQKGAQPPRLHVEITRRPDHFGEFRFRQRKELFCIEHARGFEIAVETNGTQDPPSGLDWICVSPKAGTLLQITSGDELKLVYPQVGAEPERFERLDFKRFSLQPMDGPQREENTRLAIEYCKRHPKWRLSVQMHKLLGIA